MNFHTFHISDNIHSLIEILETWNRRFQQVLKKLLFHHCLRRQQRKEASTTKPRNSFTKGGHLLEGN